MSIQAGLRAGFCYEDVCDISIFVSHRFQFLFSGN